MPGHDIIGIGASAGGVEALSRIVCGLPPDLSASIFIVLHVSPNSPSLLPVILNRNGPLHAAHAQDGEAIRRGCIYVAPPDHHLLVKRGYLRVTRGPRENSSRPAIDPLFRTAALAYSERVVGVVLSGNLDDGTAGLGAIKARGGLTIVQDPADALYPGMPRSAIERVAVDHVVPLADLPALLVQLVSEPAAGDRAEPIPEDEDTEFEADIAEMDPAPDPSGAIPGAPAGFGCSECGGSQYALSDGEILHFRSRVGHAWSPDTLLAEQSEALEAVLWTALPSLEEQAALSGDLTARMLRRDSPNTAARFEAQEITARRNAEFVRSVLGGAGLKTSVDRAAINASEHDSTRGGHAGIATAVQEETADSPPTEP